MKFEWKKKTFQGIENYKKTVFRQVKDKHSTPDEDAFTIEASPTGIRFYGTMHGHFETKDDLDSYAKCVGAAFIEHLRLKKLLRATLSAGIHRA